LVFLIHTECTLIDTIIL